MCGSQTAHRGKSEGSSAFASRSIEQRDFVALVLLLKAREVMPSATGRAKDFTQFLPLVLRAVPPSQIHTASHGPGETRRHLHEELHFVFFVSLR